MRHGRSYLHRGFARGRREDLGVEGWLRTCVVRISLSGLFFAFTGTRSMASSVESTPSITCGCTVR